MSLLDDNAARSEGTGDASQRSVSLEYPTMLHLAGKPPVMAIIETLSPSECRLRSVSVLEEGTKVDFDFTAQGAGRVTVRGTISLRVAQGVRNSYRVTLDPLQVKEKSDLAQAAQSAQRHAASRVASDVPTSNGLTRASIRVPVDLHVSYRNPLKERRNARATNLSSGGMLLKSDERLAVGSELELNVAIPGSAGTAARELALLGRIVAHQDAPSGLFDYNVAFHNVPTAIRQAITSYVDEIHVRLSATR